MFIYPEGLKSIQECKKFLEDAKVIQSYSDPTIRILKYQKPDGSIWSEVEGLLESPFDHYRLRCIDGD